MASKKVQGWPKTTEYGIFISLVSILAPSAVFTPKHHPVTVLRDNSTCTVDLVFIIILIDSRVINILSKVLKYFYNVEYSANNLWIISYEVLALTLTSLYFLFHNLNFTQIWPIAPKIGSLWDRMENFMVCSNSICCYCNSAISWLCGYDSWVRQSRDSRPNGWRQNGITVWFDLIILRIGRVVKSVVEYQTIFCNTNPKMGVLLFQWAT